MSIEPPTGVFFTAATTAFYYRACEDRNGWTEKKEDGMVATIKCALYAIHHGDFFEFTTNPSFTRHLNLPKTGNIPNKNTRKQFRWVYLTLSNGIYTLSFRISILCPSRYEKLSRPDTGQTADSHSLQFAGPPEWMANAVGINMDVWIARTTL